MSDWRTELLTARSPAEIFEGITTEQYQNASPFPHAVIDEVFNPAALDMLLATWPDPDDSRWKRYEARHESGKREGSDDRMWPGMARKAIQYIQHVLRAPLEELTGEPQLIADTWGGGLHDIEPGGYLDLHVDFDVHPSSSRLRRLNVLLFLNRDYSSEQMGHLQLAGDANQRNVRIEPRFNRMVIFTVGNGHWHGHPTPWCGTTHRRSLAVYFYGRHATQQELDNQHSTMWLR